MYCIIPNGWERVPSTPLEPQNPPSFRLTSWYNLIWLVDGQSPAPNSILCFLNLSTKFLSPFELDLTETPFLRPLFLISFPLFQKLHVLKMKRSDHHPVLMAAVFINCLTSHPFSLSSSHIISSSSTCQPAQAGPYFLLLSSFTIVCQVQTPRSFSPPSLSCKSRPYRNATGYVVYCYYNAHCLLFIVQVTSPCLPLFSQRDMAFTWLYMWPRLLVHQRYLQPSSTSCTSFIHQLTPSHS